MDSEVSENNVSRPLRRSTRRSSVKAATLSYEPTPRPPLKRRRRTSQNQAPDATVNGSREVEIGSENEDSPNKKIRMETEGAVERNGDENDNEMDVQELVEDLENDLDQDMDTDQESCDIAYHPNICREAIGDASISPRVVLGERCKPSPTQNEEADWRAKPSVEPSAKRSTKKPAPLPKNEVRYTDNKHSVPISKAAYMEKYRKTIQANTKSSVNHYVSNMDPAYEKVYEPLVHRLNSSIPAQKKTVQLKHKDGKKKTTSIKTSSRILFGGFMWCLGYLLLLVMLSFAALLSYKKISVLQRTADQKGPLNRVINPDVFTGHLSLLEVQFPTQRSELWRRSRIHLGRHLKTSQPTEPVSLILTAGNKAERTLHCLARGLASSFASALNTSVLHIEGASKVGQNSDEVKMDIDSQLQAAFEGDKAVAVIHRIEELPPGSTLIFYRYCDHENAAFKQVFLLFTVLLPQDEINSEWSLKNVEEMVQDYVQARLVGSTSPTAFNEMDKDKYGGLWSRISHLILPVVSEKDIEQKGC